MTASILVSLLLFLAGDDLPAEVLLKDGTKLVGRVQSHDEVALVLIISLGSGEDSIGGSVKRPVRWTEIEGIDGMTIAEWLDEQASTGEAPAPPAEPTGNLLERFQAWLHSRSGTAVGPAIGAIALLVLVPAFVLHRAGRLLGMRDLEAIRSLGGGLLAVGAGWAALRIEPAWFGGVPWTAVAAVAVVIWLTMRPTAGRWIVLSALEMVTLLGMIAAILYGTRFLP